MPGQKNKKYACKIGVFGSSAGSVGKQSLLAGRIGRTLGEGSAVVITGACSGLPYIAAHEAYLKGGKVWGYSPEVDLAGQKKFTPHDDIRIYQKIVYIPKTFSYKSRSLVCKKYRNVVSTATCDAGIIIAGRWGTMNEFTNLYDMGKVIGVLRGSGGIADEISRLLKKISKPGDAVVVFDRSPETLAKKVMAEVKKRKARGI